MKCGIGFAAELRTSAVNDFMRLAEELSFAQVTFPDVPNLCPETISMMTAAVLATERIEIGQGVTDPLTYHPSTIANAAATLRELSGGRSFIGLGSGGTHGKSIARGATLRELHAAMVFLREATAGRPAHWDEQVWQLTWIAESDWSGLPVPLYLAVCGPGMCRIGGERADGIYSKGVDPLIQRWRRELVHAGAKESGRGTNAVELWVRTQCYVADSKEAVRRELTPFVAISASELAAVIRRGGIAVEQLKRELDVERPGLLRELEVVAHAVRAATPTPELHRIVSQDLLDFFVITGSPSEVRRQLAALGSVGVAGVSIGTHGLQDPARVLSEFRDAVV